MGVQQDLDIGLEALGIADKETFSEYIMQLIQEETMEKEEKKEAICEFLAEFSLNKVDTLVDTLLHEWEVYQQEILLNQQQERLEALALEKEKEHQVLQQGMELTKDKPVISLTREEKKKREALLAKYGYDLDDIVEKENGEVEILYKGSRHETMKSNSNLEKNRNADIVKEQEAAKRYQAQQEHQKVVARNKELLEKQRLDKEKEKKRTQKGEKRRM